MDSCTSCDCFLEGTCLAGVHPLVGNDFCNDETNIKECDYDGFECCGFHSSSYHVNQDFCTDCLCKGMCFICILDTPGPRLMRIHLVRNSTNAKFQKSPNIHIVRPITHFACVKVCTYFIILQGICINEALNQLLIS